MAQTPLDVVDLTAVLPSKRCSITASRLLALLNITLPSQVLNMVSLKKKWFIFISDMLGSEEAKYRIC